MTSLFATSVTASQAPAIPRARVRAHSDDGRRRLHPSVPRRRVRGTRNRTAHRIPRDRVGTSCPAGGSVGEAQGLTTRPRLGAWRFAEGVHRNRSVLDVDDLEVFGFFRCAQDYAVARARLHQRAR